jgi:hydrogenase expression/formation protein HypD
MSPDKKKAKSQRFISDFLIKKINDTSSNLGTIRIMEVCGTHTMSIARNGVKAVLPKNIELLSGPGCPVCVTDQGEIDGALELSDNRSNIIVTFGDMLKVPGSDGLNLEQARAAGCDIRVVYTPRDAIKIAVQSNGKTVVFISVGFETTSPAVALVVKEADMRQIKNLKILALNKLIPPAMHAVAEESKINGFICPGHVSVVIGTKSYKVFPDKYGIGAVVSGFEAIDILESIYMLVKQIEEKRPAVENQYSAVVSKDGNPIARRAIHEVFEKCDARWRGLGKIKSSGLRLNKDFRFYDALSHFGIKMKRSSGQEGCECGEILKGKLNPRECGLFAIACTPDSPIGPCMVSSEGSCAAEFYFADNSGEKSYVA